MSGKFVDAIAPLVEAVGGTLIDPDRLEVGDVALEWRGRTVVGVRLAPLHDALGRLIAIVEGELGAPLSSLSRADKQYAVAMLDDMGAFALRKSVEDVADALAVSRFTVYNYLNAVGTR